MHDGSIIFDTGLDNAKMQKQLQRLKIEIGKLESSISGQEVKKAPFVQQAEVLEQKMKSARAEVQRYKQAWQEGTVGADKDQINAAAKLQEIEGQYAKVVAQIDKIDEKLAPAHESLNEMKMDAGGIEQHLALAGTNTEKMDKATKKANKNMERFALRLKEVVRSALVFTVITQALAKFREWTGKVIRSNAEASASVAKLKGALLTLAQPLVDVIIPAFTAFVNVLTNIISAMSDVMSMIFGKTKEASAEAAEKLHEETSALDGVGDAAKRAGKSMARFDTINQVSGDKSSSSGGGKGGSKIEPVFSMADDGWLSNTLGKAAGWVTAALLLGGVALVAIGAMMGKLSLIVAGLMMLVTGFSIGAETGVLQSWVDVLGLNSVTEFVTIALLLGGIALVAFGAGMGNALMVLTGLGLLAAGIAVGVKSGTFASWAKTLGLETVFDYVTAAIQLAGISLIAIGAAMGNIFMIVAGVLLFSAGVAAEIIGEETLKSWWEVLKLTTVQQWVAVTLLLVGICLVAIGAAMGNVVMVIAGISLLGLGTIVAASEGNLKDWVTVLGLEKVVGWVTVALLLAGIGLVVFGIVSGNMLMVLAGLGLLGAGVAVGVTSGTFQSWIDTIISGLKSGLVTISGFWNMNIAKYFTAEYWMGLGKDMLDGLMGGLSSIGSKIGDWGSGFIEGVKDFFGIHSPSTEFEALAGYMISGLSNGLGDNDVALAVFTGLLTQMLVATQGTTRDMQLLFAGFLLYLMVEFKNGWTSNWQQLRDISSQNIQSIIQEINALNAKLASIERNIVITITTVYKSVGGSSGSSGGSSAPKSAAARIAAMPATLQAVPMATGGVIPPNREFLALYGDHRSGNNIEAPESLIRKIVREEGGGAQSTRLLQSILDAIKAGAVVMVDRDKIGRVVYDTYNSERNRVGVTLTSR